MKQWNKRWFVLADRCLFYYKGLLSFLSSSLLSPLLPSCLCSSCSVVLHLPSLLLVKLQCLALSSLLQVKLQCVESLLSPPHEATVSCSLPSLPSLLSAHMKQQCSILSHVALVADCGPKHPEKSFPFLSQPIVRTVGRQNHTV